MTRPRLAALVLAATTLAAACAHDHTAVRTPKWVSRGSGVFKDKGEGVVFGVASAATAEAADAAARAELGKVSESFTPSLTKDYMTAALAAGVYPQSEAADQEQHMGQTIKNLMKFSRNAATVAERWTDAGGTHYALCRLDAAGVLATIEDSRELDPKALHYVRDHVKDAFAERAKR